MIGRKMYDLVKLTRRSFVGRCAKSPKLFVENYKILCRFSDRWPSFVQAMRLTLFDTGSGGRSL